MGLDSPSTSDDTGQLPPEEEHHTREALETEERRESSEQAIDQQHVEIIPAADVGRSTEGEDDDDAIDMSVLIDDEAMGAVEAPGDQREAAGDQERTEVIAPAMIGRSTEDRGDGDAIDASSDDHPPRQSIPVSDARSMERECFGIDWN